MKALITTELVRRYRQTPPATVTDIYDTKQPKLVLRARPTGAHTYRVALGRARWLTIGLVTDFSHPDKARGLAQAKLGEVAYGKDPQAEKRAEKQSARTLGTYLDETYAPWVRAHLKNGERTVSEIRAAFRAFLAARLCDLTAGKLEAWRTARLAEVTPQTTNRNLTYLKAMLARAVEWGHLDVHPLKIKMLHEDKIGRLRFLSTEEETRLRAALDARDTKRRTARAQSNEWRRARDYDESAALGTYTDHLTPIVLLALNTGLRFGELTALRWRDLDLKACRLHALAGKTKTGRHVPLNSEAVTVLRAWRAGRHEPEAYVFPGAEGERIVDIKTAWKPLLAAAQIEGFRFHDLRHTFASNLVMGGSSGSGEPVDINTVRELLGHTTMNMTLRYAHLAPEHKAAAVEKLVRPAVG